MLELWLIRHGETDWNRERRIQGQSQNSLSDLGVRQGQRLAVRLAEEHFDLIYSSDLKRAFHTAQLVYPRAAILRDERLREIARGVLEGKIDAEMTPEELKIREEMRGNRHMHRPPGGENFEDVAARVQSWLAELPKEGRVIAFTHGGVIHCLLRMILETPGPTSWEFAINNASITRVSFEAAATIHVVNDHAHLLGRENLWSY